MTVEAKASNTSTISVKRHTNDAAAKARYWSAEFGPSDIVRIAILSVDFNHLKLTSAMTSIT